MIEMNLHDDPLGDDPDDYPVYRGRAGELWRLAFSAPSMAIASLLIGLASLTIVQAADEIGEIFLFTSNGNNLSNLTEIRVGGAVRLVIAVIALTLAVACGLRVLAADDDEEPESPLWVRSLAGAALVVALVAVILSASSLIYALEAHASASNNFG
jgi:hypothetical protein